MKALTASEMRLVDRLTTERFGIPSLQLMEAAGRRVAYGYWQTRTFGGWRAREIWVLCGKGNNGGDGFVVARHLHGASKPKNTHVAETHVHVALFGQPDELRGDAATNCQRWRELGGEVVCVPNEKSWEAAWSEVSRTDVIIDAMFGTGFRGAASGAIGQAIQDINRYSRNATAARPLILAVDTPSGLPSDGQSAEGPLLRAHHTITFTAPKVGQLISHDADAVGALHVVNIGSPATLVDEVGKGMLRWAGPEEFSELPLVRKSDGHKGLYGHILVVAGSLGKTGAAIMAGHSALCAGAGLVTVATPAPVLPIVASAFPEYMTEPLATTDVGTAARQNLEGSRFTQIEEGKTVLAVGPGLGQHPETQDFIRSIVRGTELPVILDADGLNAFAGRAEELRDRKAHFLAITPHPGEMARLLDASTKDVQADRVKTARDAATRWRVYVILKGSHTILASPDGQVLVNTTGNPGLAKGGSGDVLTGILAALTGQFKTDDWLRVLALGVYLHGAAADCAVRQGGIDPSGLLASEVANAIPQARLKLLQELQRRE